ncbi:MAG: DUF3180 domain-containing protein [Propionicimonas sp.]
MSDPDGPQPTVAATSWRVVGIAIVVGAGIGWSLFSALDALGWPAPQLPIVVTFAIALLAVIVAVQAARTHRTIQVRREVLPARRAVALLVLGKTCLLAGAGMAAAYAAVIVYFWSRQDASLPRERVASSAVAVVASVGLAVAGAFLERACRIPPSDEDATPPAHP